MFKKFLARFGKGAATVDLHFEDRPYNPGEIILGEVNIQGGEVEQKVNHLAVRMIMSVVTKQGSVVREVDTIPLSGAYLIIPKEEKVISFKYQIPTNLPISRRTVSYYFDTILDIEGGVDRSDVDRLVVEVPQKIKTIFCVLENIGFREKHDSGKLDQYGQEFAFFPTQFLAEQVSEIEFRFAHEGNGIYVWMEVDCQNGYHEFEAKREFYLEDTVFQNEVKLTELLKQYMTEAVERPHDYAQPFSYTSPHEYEQRHGNPLGGMIGGLAMGLLGSMLLSEMMGSAAEAIGFDDEEIEVEDNLDFGDFFGEDDD
jgi:sporulation-control protein